MIFLVDDDPIQNMLTSRLIEQSAPEMKYMVFQNGEEVIQALDKGIKPLVIILDINMPIMDGWEFLEAYRSHQKKAKVYMLTSSSNDEDRRRAEDFDCISGYYTKPIDGNAVKQIISELS